MSKHLIMGFLIAAGSVLPGVVMGQSIPFEFIEAKDLSYRATGDRVPSEFTDEELAQLPMTQRLGVGVLVPDSVTADQVEHVARSVLSDLTSRYPDIDEMVLSFYSDSALLGQEADAGQVVWSTEGELGGISASIADQNLRQDYELGLEVPDDLSAYPHAAILPQSAVGDPRASAGPSSGRS